MRRKLIHMRSWRSHLFTFVLFCSGSLLFAASTAEEMSSYRAWHDLCLQGDVKVIDQQITKFEQRLTSNPEDHLAKAFLGSACALRAKYGKWGPTKLKYLNRGRKLANSAVASAPSDGRVRMVRAIAYSRIPSRFGVKDIAVQDFQALIFLAKSGEGLTKCERQAILYHAGKTFQDEKIEGAAELFALCKQIDPHSSYAQRIQ